MFCKQRLLIYDAIEPVTVYIFTVIDRTPRLDIANWRRGITQAGTPLARIAHDTALLASLHLTSV